jgi:heavy metal sensor kinase
MLNGSSIRVRLAVAYFVSVGVVLGALAVGSYVTMRASTVRAIDISLRYQLDALESFLRERAATPLAQLGEELARGAQAGSLFQLAGADGTPLYQSPGLARHGIRIDASAPSESARFRDAGPSGWPVRLASRRITVGGKVVVIEAAEALRSYRSSWREYGRAMWLLAPALAAVAAGVGYWMSGRALAPVDRIIAEADAIGSERGLSARLSVPPARDELRRLSETLNAMLARIEESVLRMTQFTADASHELRAPLALIQMAAEHSLRRERPREDLVESLETVLREARRMSQLVDDLLLLARADAGLRKGEPAVTDLAQVVRDVADRTRPLAMAKSIAFLLDADASPAPVAGEAALLHRLVLILVDNAIKYTPERGSVRLALSTTYNAASVDVVDTGIGIDAEDVPRLFDRFWRADEARSRGTGGSGLGLSIAKWIVDASAGTLTVSSEPDRGSTFRVTLPLVTNADESRRSMTNPA